jgi:hypothetical protein
MSRLEHDPEKWKPVFRKDHARNKKIERDDDSKKSHPALGGRPAGVNRALEVSRSEGGIFSNNPVEIVSERLPDPVRVSEALITSGQLP